MARPLRIEYPGALYHLTCRGNEKRPTFLDDEDRHLFLYLLGETVQRFGWIVSAYVLMTNHYYLNVVRYTVLNPVRANIVADPARYPWSSYCATAGLAAAPDWLAVDDVLRRFAPVRATAQAMYRIFVHDPIAAGENPWSDLVGGIYLGSPDWIEKTRERVESRLRDSEHPRAQRRLRGWYIGAAPTNAC